MTTEAKVIERTKIHVEPPKLWKVIFLNDDHTPMDLVIELLTGIFKHSEARAKEITLEIHETGSGVAGVYTYEIAEQKGIEATAVARHNGAPLQIQVEQE